MALLWKTLDIEIAVEDQETPVSGVGVREVKQRSR